MFNIIQQMLSGFIILPASAVMSFYCMKILALPVFNPLAFSSIFLN